MKKLLKSCVAMVLAVLMIMPLATQASARQTPLPRPHQTANQLLGQAPTMTVVTIGGRTFNNAIQFPTAGTRSIVGFSNTDHRIGGQQATISGYVFRTSALGSARIQFFNVNERGTARLISSHPIRSGQRVYADVRGVETLRIQVQQSNDSLIPIPATFVFADPQLCNDMEAAAARFDRSNLWNFIALAGGLALVVVGVLVMAFSNRHNALGLLATTVGGGLVIFGSSRLFRIQFS
ncbi:MAG: hypothetical protein FWB76_07915 [Oscillospiraceae bacterium]|nr:hypothetical protein [Oscillospiraceae bacterium]